MKNSRMNCASGLALALLFPVAFAGDLALIDCKPTYPAEKDGSTLWPKIFLKQRKLCFDVTGWMNYKGANCTDSSGSASWSAISLIFVEGESLGRDVTDFRVQEAVITDEKIEYLVEWRRSASWHSLQKVSINRLTGEGVDWSVSDHGGTPLTCESRKRKL